MYLPSPAAVSTYISTFSTSTSYSQYHNIHNLNSEVRSAQPRGLSDSNTRSDAPPFCSIVDSYGERSSGCECYSWMHIPAHTLHSGRTVGKYFCELMRSATAHRAADSSDTSSLQLKFCGVENYDFSLLHVQPPSTPQDADTRDSVTLHLEPGPVHQV